MSEHIKGYEKTINCSNCGCKGHSYRYCKEPIQSLGVIVFRINGIEERDYSWDSIRDLDKPEKSDDYIDSYDNIEFLMIRRRDSLGYVEFLRGRYALSDIDFIINIFEEMTVQEKNKIKNQKFEKLWCDMWLIDKVEKKGPYKKEFYVSKEKFNKIKNGYILDGNVISLTNILLKLKNSWDEPEWGFPKGRRNPKETDIDCANRELKEETGIESDDYIFYRNVKSFEETFLGSNNVLYKHVYFLGKFNAIKPLELTIKNKHQRIEISKIDWMNYELLKKKIRPYNTKRLKIIKSVLNTIKYKGLDK